MLSLCLLADSDGVCYRNRCALSNTCPFVPMQTYVKDMSSTPLVVDTAAESIRSITCSRKFRLFRIALAVTILSRSAKQIQAVRGWYTSHCDLETNRRSLYVEREQDCYTICEQLPHCHKPQRTNFTPPLYCASKNLKQSSGFRGLLKKYPWIKSQPHWLM